ncbi:C6 zinc finger domain-containing protein [Cercophora scortea]|uniref:C6 zinc finger domain-containing protein n=1 Tax=Cercophora scortea TaxID=314031 RepID=A0AAE0M4H0_9PEZI|nr:C6 zinc finger domain-containing protein [Cercophora scortea]
MDAMLSSPHDSASASASAARSPANMHQTQSEAKRRRLRKGTHSCWECKRRKMKCIFDTLTNATVCNGCRRRGSQCVSQEYPEDEVPVSAAGDRRGGYRAHKSVDRDGAGSIRVAVVEQTPLHRRRDTSATASDGTSPTTTPSEDGRHHGRGDHGIPTPVSITSESSRYLAFYKSLDVEPAASGTNKPVSRHGKFEELSRFLHEALPSREDTERICNASRHPSVLAHEIMTMPYSTLDQSGLKTPDSLLEIPGPHMHPVLIARHMLLLATFLQHLHPDLHKEIKGLSESPRAIMERLADLAVSLVTTNDELLGSIEGLECVMIESVYQANVGNLRRSWVSSRRAMGIAQLMGLNRADHRMQYKVLDTKTQYHPQLMWFRIVFLDRYLCLMLGLSQGCLDRSMASDALLANDTPMGRLERIHCVIASQILERNESSPSSHDVALTRTLDVELQKAARSLPSKWWLVPNLDVAAADSQALFWNTRRMFAQLLHYNLLNQLHLPYMLRSSSSPERKYEYSRITCVNASREMLSRFITLRSFNGLAFSCRTVDFLALMAAMTLLLAHIDSHLSDAGDNLLAHQYHTDRAMIEQVQENMRAVNRINADALSSQSADLLHRLLAVEAEAANAYPRGGGRRVSVHEAGTELATPASGQDGDAVISVHIPYFGIIRIAREGLSKEGSNGSSRTAQPVENTTENTNLSFHLLDPQMRPAGRSGTGGVTGAGAEVMTPADSGYCHVETSPIMSEAYAKSQGYVGLGPFPVGAGDDTGTCGGQFAPPQLQNPGLSDQPMQYGEYPGPAAGAEDWAFQGVDLAFFESLMRSTGAELL